MLTQHAGLAWIVLCGVVGLLLLLVAFAARRRRAHARAGAARALRTQPDAFAAANLEASLQENGEAEAIAPETAPAAAALDAAEIMLALQDAEKSGAEDRLPALHLALARCRLAEGAADEAAELLRKSIRGAAGESHKQTHAEARVVLGDIAQAHGDATTACEHWQIARALFHELRRQREHTEVETRMLKNGCPTDWVLTDF